MKTTVTELGQVPVPAELCQEMQLTPGSTLVWELVSPTECRLRVEAVSAAKTEPPIKVDPMAAIGFAQQHGLPVMTTAEYMKLIRGDEED